MSSSEIKRKSEHIYYMGNGMVKDNEVRSILKELEKYDGLFYEGISQNGMTVIEKVD